MKLYFSLIILFVSILTISCWDSENISHPSSTDNELDLTGWEFLDQENMSIATQCRPRVAFDIYGETPYIVSDDGVLREFDGNNWNEIGNGRKFYPPSSLQVDNDKIYIGHDRGTRFIVSRIDIETGEVYQTPELRTESRGDCLMSISNGTIYIAYQPKENTPLIVKRFCEETSEWIDLGSSSVLEGTDYLAFSVYDGLPYIAYQHAWPNSVGLHVKKFDGERWDYVGEEYVSRNYIQSIALSVDKGTPYIAYSCLLKGSNEFETEYGGVNIKRFNGNDWATIGTPKLFNKRTWQISLQVHDGTLYIANDSLEVESYNGGSWEDVSAGCTDCTTCGLVLRLNDDEIPYLAYLGFLMPAGVCSGPIVTRYIGN